VQDAGVVTNPPPDPALPPCAASAEPTRNNEPGSGFGPIGPAAPVEQAERVERLHDAYDRTHARLWRALRAWSGSREAAAEAFAQAARRGDALRDIDAWVWRAGFRIASGELQRRRRRPTPVGDTVSLLAATADPATSGTDPDLPDDAIDLVRALRRLSEQQRACLVLRDVAGLSAAEIADALHTSPGTVRMQIFRSRRVLRALLEDHDD
jgi:RNA polymerase sigma-70 factor (ECF subfamily)